MKRTFLFLCLIVGLTACSSDHDFEVGKRQLESQGYTNVKNTGWEGFCCDSKDNFSTGFTAIDSKGKPVEGCMCSGVLKGVTIRFE